MDFRQIESFVKVSATQNFSRAADELFLSQPTISAHILQLEKSLGYKLINRSSRNITLTKSGEIFLDYATKLLELRDKMIREILAYNSEIVGKLAIRASSIPLAYYLPAVIAGFISKYPKISIDYQNINSMDILEGILNNSIEFGIVGNILEDTNLSYHKLVEDKLVLILSKDNPLSKKETITLTDILEEDFILRSSGSGTLSVLASSLEKNRHGIRDLNIKLICDNNESIISHVSHNIGISVVSYMSVQARCESLNIITKDIEGLDMGRNFYFVDHKYRELSPLASRFKSYLLDS